jgi:hypothetical protein
VIYDIRLLASTTQHPPCFSFEKRKRDSLEEKLKKETHKKLSPFTIIILFHRVDRYQFFHVNGPFHNIRHKEEEEAFSIFSSALLANHLEPSKKQNKIKKILFFLYTCSQVGEVQL